MPHRPKPHRPRSVPVPKRLQRPTSAQRGYNAHWRRLRRMVLSEHPLCADPFGVHAAEGRIVAAWHVDHILPLAAGGTNDDENLQPLCADCHRRKTVHCDGGFGRERRPMAKPQGAGFRREWI